MVRICLTVADSQSLAEPFTLAMTSRSAVRTQRRSCSDQTLVSSGGVSDDERGGLHQDGQIRAQHDARPILRVPGFMRLVDPADKLGVGESVVDDGLADLTGVDVLGPLAAPLAKLFFHNVGPLQKRLLKLVELPPGCIHVCRQDGFLLVGQLFVVGVGQLAGLIFLDVRLGGVDRFLGRLCRRDHRSRPDQIPDHGQEQGDAESDPEPIFHALAKEFLDLIHGRRCLKGRGFRGSEGRRRRRREDVAAFTRISRAPSGPSINEGPSAGEFRERAGWKRGQQVQAWPEPSAPRGGRQEEEWPGWSEHPWT